MAPIFENRKIEVDEAYEVNKTCKDKLKFPPCLTHLPSQLAGLKVKYGQKYTSLTIKKEDSGIWVITGWREFAKQEAIKAGDKISLSEEDDYAHCRIEVN